MAFMIMRSFECVVFTHFIKNGIEFWGIPSLLIEIIISFSFCLSGFCLGSLSVAYRGAGSLPTETQGGVARRG